MIALRSRTYGLPPSSRKHRDPPLRVDIGGTRGNTARSLLDLAAKPGVRIRLDSSTLSNVTYIRGWVWPYMPNMTFAVPEELHREIRRHRDVRWSEIARRALVREVNRLHIYDRLLSQSVLTEADAVELGRRIRRRKSTRGP